MPVEIDLSADEVGFLEGPEAREGLGRPFRVRFTKPISRIGFV